MALSSPVWKLPGTLNGRLVPAHSSPCGQEGSYYYYPYTYTYPDSYYYVTGDEYVFCLGEDIATFQEYRLQVGDILALEQTYTPDTTRRLLRFCWHMKTPEMPAGARSIVGAGEVSFLSGGLISRPLATHPAGTSLFLDGTADGESGLVVHGEGLGLFTPSDYERRVLIAGATDPGNNGTKRINSVPFSHGIVVGGDRIGLDAPITERLNDAGVSVQVNGLRWVARVKTDHGTGWITRLEHSEVTGHNQVRADLAINVSKLAVQMVIRFEMELQEMA